MQLQSSMPSLQVCQCQYTITLQVTHFQVANTTTGPADAPPPWFQAAIDRLNARLDQQQYAMFEIKRIAAIVCMFNY